MERRAELKGVTAHVLRHSFASLADEVGYTEATVGALLGHRSGSVTRVDAAAISVSGDAHRFGVPG
jgi:integrase